MNRIKPEDFDRNKHDIKSDINTAPITQTNVVWTPAPTNLSPSNPQSNTTQDIKSPLSSFQSASSQTNKVGAGWKVSTFIFALTATIFGFGWQYHYRTAKSYLSYLNSVQTELQQTSQNSQGKIKTLESQLADEKRKRKDLVENVPLTITEIKFRNENSGTIISGYQTEFYEPEIRYIWWYVTIQNNRDETTSGDLYVKFIKPNGELMSSSSSPTNYSMKESISVSNMSTVSRGWGYDTGGSYKVLGNYRVQFWWNGKIIGEKSFNVY